MFEPELIYSGLEPSWNSMLSKVARVSVQRPAKIRIRKLIADPEPQTTNQSSLPHGLNERHLVDLFQSSQAEANFVERRLA